MHLVLTHGRDAEQTATQRGFIPRHRQPCLSCLAEASFRTAGEVLLRFSLLKGHCNEVGLPVLELKQDTFSKLYPPPPLYAHTSGHLDIFCQHRLPGIMSLIQ